MSKNLNQLKNLKKAAQQLWMTAAQTPTINLRALPVLLKKIIILLIGVHFLQETSSILTELFPIWSRHEVSIFIRPGFEAKMPINWWLKYLSDDVFNVITYYCLAMVAKHVSNILFLICVIFLSYHVIDLFMYFWDFKTSRYFYFDLFYTAIIFIKLAVNGYNSETIAKIKSLF